MPLEDGSWEMAAGNSVSGADGGWSPASFCFGATGMENGVCGSGVAGFVGAKPIRNGDCSPGVIGGSIAGNGFNFSGKSGNAGAEISGAG
jgi:hypothetical protein